MSFDGNRLIGTKKARLNYLSSDSFPSLGVFWERQRRAHTPDFVEWVEEQRAQAA